MGDEVSLTPLEARVLAAIERHVRCEGVAPTIAELATDLRLRSRGTVHRYVQSLIGKGRLERHGNGWRGLRIVGMPMPDRPSNVHRLPVRRGGDAGNVGTATAVNASLETVAPDAPTITALITNDTTPTLTGQADIAAGTTLSVRVNGIAYLSAEGGVALEEDGGWSLTVDVGDALDDGLYEVLATLTDRAGNAVDDESGFELTIDTEPPAVPTVASLVTNDATPTITGTSALEPGDELSVSIGGVPYTVALGTLVIDGAGNWTLTVAAADALPDGIVEVEAAVTDAAGNVAIDASADELTVDTVAPATPTIETLATAGVVPARPLAVAFFSNEEGARFAPDMMGSLVYVGGLGLEQAHQTVGIDRSTVGDELDRIGYRGPAPCPGLVPHAFVELHIEQGPVLEQQAIDIGVVESVQGISWTEVTIEGQSNHAGTTPMRLRRDAGYAAASVATFVRSLAEDLGHPQVGTVGMIDLHPNLVNVVAASATLTVDLRNTDNEVLTRAEKQLHTHLDELAAAEGVAVSTRSLARFDPVRFDTDVVDSVEDAAQRLGATTLRMPSGAGHDAQMMARVCPTAMIFTPSREGISHNPAEHTEPHHLAMGANTLLQVMMALM